MNTQELNDFADRMIVLGQYHGYIMGLKRANELLRKHGVEVSDPARRDISAELYECTVEGVQAYRQGAVSAVVRRELPVEEVPQ